MDGRGRALDNVFCERLWRSVKYENIYLNQYDTVPSAARLAAPISTYTTLRDHIKVSTIAHAAEEHFVLWSRPHSSKCTNHHILFLSTIWATIVS